MEKIVSEIVQKNKSSVIRLKYYPVIDRKNHCIIAGSIDSGKFQKYISEKKKQANNNMISVEQKFVEFSIRDMIAQNNMTTHEIKYFRRRQYILDTQDKNPNQTIILEINDIGDESDIPHVTDYHNISRFQETSYTCCCDNFVVWKERKYLDKNSESEIFALVEINIKNITESISILEKEISCFSKFKI
ncbi:MAG: hypothetical protein Dasosvirus5_4 [Dasosvirus sp.]|uniref:Uncharacterized protein n=1 Tax=Dasosvirus sp. TaxID=2487764 RepID=A0A3G4ZRN2_9VIRU|nr:MAG: hypothetical protein Dasosvirus5_4 [Dasosvirus sp.]